MVGTEVPFPSFYTLLSRKPIRRASLLTHCGSVNQRSVVFTQVLDLTQQMSSASEQRRAAVHERAELEAAIVTAQEAHNRMQAEVTALQTVSRLGIATLCSFLGG